MEWPLEFGLTQREFYRLLDRAATGEEVVFIRHGEPIGRLLAPATSLETTAVDAVSALSYP